MSSVSDRNRLNPQNRPRQSIIGSSLVPHTLIDTVYWLHKLCSAPSWFDWVGKRPYVKADLANYSHVLGECMDSVRV